MTEVPMSKTPNSYHFQIYTFALKSIQFNIRSISHFKVSPLPGQEVARRVRASEVLSLIPGEELRVSLVMK